MILASHLGRPDGKVTDSLRLRPVAERLGQLIGRTVPVTGDALGVGTQDAVGRMRNGEMLLLENLRFHAEEEKNDPVFAEALASYCDVYVNDAFGTAHRAHASTVGIAKLRPAYAGLLMEKRARQPRQAPRQPRAPVRGRSSAAPRSATRSRCSSTCSTRSTSWSSAAGMANTFLLAQGKPVGKSLAEPDRVEDARAIMAAAEEQGVKVVLPVDVVMARRRSRAAPEYKTVPAEKVPASWHIVDLGKQSLANIEEALADVRTVLWNGPLGVFEIPSFAHGTKAIARFLARRAEEGAAVVVGGGDSVAAITQQGLADKMTHISTGGGASLEFLEGRELPGVTVLLDRQPEAVK